MFLNLALLTGFSALTMIFAGTLSLLRNPGREEHRWFFLVTLSLAIWVTVNFLGSNLTDTVFTEIFVKLDFTFALLSCWFLVQFAASVVSHNPYFNGKKKFKAQNPVFRAVSFGVVLVLCLAVASGYVLHAALIDGKLVVDTMQGFWVYIAAMVSLLIYGMTILVGGFWQIGKRDREGLQVILIGLLIFILTNVASNLVFPYIFTERSVIQQLNIVGYLGVLGFVVCIYLAITLKKLFDIRLSVLRGAVYVLTLAALGIVYVGPIVFVLGVVVMGLEFRWYPFLTIVLVSTFGAAQFIRIKQWFDKLTREFFFRDSYDSAQLIGELNRMLVSSLGLGSMLPDAAALIARNLKTEYCVFVLKDTLSSGQRIFTTPTSRKEFTQASFKSFSSGRLKLPSDIVDIDYLPAEYSELRTNLAKNDVAVLVRLSSSAHQGSEEIGYMLLGFKKSGNPYNAQDFHAIEAIADVMVIAVQNAQHYEEIQKFNITLQQKVEEATRKLRRTNAKLETLDETKDDFISMASHQLRTPLTSVKGYLSMVLEGDAGKLTAMQRKMLDQAFVSSQRMVFLISDLLNISRLKTGKFVIDPSKINLATMVSEEVRQLQETAKTRSLELVFNKPEDFPDLMLDETKTRQVIMNFIDNAIYYTPAGGRIEIALADRPDAIELKVSDNGIGVPKSEQQHLFTKFYRAGNARRTRPDGTGLGLFMAKKVIIAQGGAVIFSSKEGEGSTFGFALSKAKVLPK